MLIVAHPPCQPLQSHYPRFRRPLSPIWWALWGAPTDAQFAVQLLRRRHLERQKAKHPPAVADDNLTSKASKNINGLRNRLRGSSAAHAVAYGSMKPLNETEGGLVDLRDTKILDGQITSKPRKLGSFFCQHHGVPGHLHVSTKMLYFVALHSHVNKEGKGRKTCKTLLEDVSGLVKTKSIKLFVWSSSGLQVIRKDKGSLFFSNMPHRDNAFNLLLAVGSEGECIRTGRCTSYSHPATHPLSLEQGVTRPHLTSLSLSTLPAPHPLIPLIPLPFSRRTVRQSHSMHSFFLPFRTIHI